MGKLIWVSQGIAGGELCVFRQNKSLMSGRYGPKINLITLMDNNDKPLHVVVSKEDNLKGKKKWVLIAAFVGFFILLIVLGSSL